MKDTALAALGKASRLVHEVRFMAGARRVPRDRFDLQTLAQAKRFFDEHGWVLFKHVFTEAEIDAFRAGVLASEREGDAGDLLSNHRLRGVLLDERVLSIARSLLGDTPTYYGDSSWYSSSTHPFALGFHKDNADKFNARGPDWQGAYPLLRIGVYLQDHTTHSGGVAIRDRSHLTTDCAVGQPFAAPTARGDVVVWSLRTSHSGLVSRLRLLPQVFLPLTLQNALVVRRRGPEKGAFRPPRLLFLPLEHAQRLALFMTFGLDGPHMRRYIQYLKTRRYAVILWQKSRYTDEARALVSAKGIRLIDVPREVVGIDPATVPEEHRDPPDGFPELADR